MYSTTTEQARPEGYALRTILWSAGGWAVYEDFPNLLFGPLEPAVTPGYSYRPNVFLGSVEPEETRDALGNHLREWLSAKDKVRGHKGIGPRDIELEIFRWMKSTAKVDAERFFRTAEAPEIAARFAAAEAMHKAYIRWEADDNSDLNFPPPTDPMYEELRALVLRSIALMQGAVGA